MQSQLRNYHKMKGVHTMKTLSLILLLSLGMTVFSGGAAHASSNYEEQSYAVENPSSITAIRLTEVDVPVEVLSSGDDSMHVSYYTSEYEKYEIEVHDSTLHITKKISFHWFISVEPPEEVKLTLYLPVNYAGDMEATAADGNIHIGEVPFSRLSVKTGDGGISISKTQIAEDVICETLDGDIKIDGVSATDMKLKTMDGDISFDRPAIANSLSCRAVDGDIEGTLVGQASDYTLIVKTADGDSNIASGGSGAKQCELKTIDGDVTVAFEGN